jgi:hypothetical protein
MLTALYYPNVTISSGLLKNALFLWDRLEYIAPDANFEPVYSDRQLRDAAKTITERHVPSKKCKREVQEAIVELLERPLPNWFFVKDLPPEQRYSFYPLKFCPETWDALLKKGLAESMGDGFDTSVLALHSCPCWQTPVQARNDVW